jgi:hypothetical protein
MFTKSFTIYFFSKGKIKPFNAKLSTDEQLLLIACCVNNIRLQLFVVTVSMKTRVASSKTFFELLE